MKKALVFLLVLFISLVSKAQSLDFDATVKYINDSFSNRMAAVFEGNSDNGYGANKVKVTKDGRVVFSYGDEKPRASFNLFDVAKFDAGPRGLMLKDKDDSLIVRLDVPSPDAARLAKAFIHLRSLCNKSLDPFAP